MKTHNTIACRVAVLAAVFIACAGVLCRAEGAFDDKSRELTQDDLNKGYDSAFKMDMKHHTAPTAPDQKKVLDVDNERPLGSEGNIRTDDEMSNQGSYTE